MPVEEADNASKDVSIPSIAEIEDGLGEGRSRDVRRTEAEPSSEGAAVDFATRTRVDVPPGVAQFGRKR